MGVFVVVDFCLVLFCLFVFFVVFVVIAFVFGWLVCLLFCKLPKTYQIPEYFEDL